MTEHQKMILIGVAIHVAMVMFFAWVPGSIARNRRHSKAEAISVCGWIGSIFVWLFWFVAIVWSFTEDNRPTPRRRQCQIDWYTG